MEKRAILAAVLMAAVFIVYQTFFFPEAPVAPKPPAPAATQPIAPAPPVPSAPAAAAPAVPGTRAPQSPRPPQRLAPVETPLYRDVVSSEGGKLQELVLRYRGEKPMVIVGDLGPQGLLLSPDGNGPGDVISMSLDKDAVTATDKPVDLVLTGESDGLKIRQTLRFHPGGYAIDALLRVENASGATRTIAPGHAWEGNVTLYAGPKEHERLKALGLEGTINFGGFPLPRKWGGLPMEWLGVPILLLMNWTYKHVGNYGVAIILLTVVSKVLFYPLTVKSMRSMKAMQALQPQVNALRSKYQKDPQTLQRETLALYKKHRVNPMGGCLPMIAQVAIFYALYLALSVSVELENARFLCFITMPAWVPGLGGADLWICDLAAHDPTYVLPVLMGVTMFVQQKLTPTAGDPRQAKMMLVMPFVFTFMFLNLPSGLVLYWTVSNILQIVQQKLMDRPARSGAAREAKDAGRA